MFTKVHTFQSILGVRIASTIFMPIRCIYILNMNYNKYQARESRFMRKLMGNKNSEKRPWYKSERDAMMPSVFKTTVSQGKQNFRRTVVLNKLFMQHISDMIATGSIADEIVGKGLEISRVKTAPDFKQVNVYWIARGTEDDAVVEKILNKYSWQLRHEISQLRVIGVVPPIHFVKDKTYAKVVEVDRILAKADFGEDYVPVTAGYNLKREFSQTSQPQPDTVNKTEEPESDEKVQDEEPVLPPMRTDVLGLKHEDIMTKIKRGNKKAKALHRHSPSHSLPDDVSPTRAEPTMHDTVKLKNEDFTKFLVKRQYLNRKMLRGKKNYAPEKELYETEALENSKVANEFLNDIDKENDYIEPVENMKRD